MSEAPAILVVDDEPAMCGLLAEQLRASGYAPSVAYSVGEALDLIRGDRFRAVLSDIRLKGENGFELLRAVRQLGRSLPVILMTSFGSDATERRAQAEGAVAFLRKPFGVAELREALQRLPEI
jgi:CheY-like chemotaxis protein